MCDVVLLDRGRGGTAPGSQPQRSPTPATDCDSDPSGLTWPQGADLATKLWGSAENLYRTAGFVASTGLKIWPARLLVAEEEEEEEEETEKQADKQANKQIHKICPLSSVYRMKAVCWQIHESQHEGIMT